MKCSQLNEYSTHCISEGVTLISDPMDSHASWQSIRGSGHRRDSLGAFNIEESLQSNMPSLLKYWLLSLSSIMSEAYRHSAESGWGTSFFLIVSLFFGENNLAKFSFTDLKLLFILSSKASTLATSSLSNIVLSLGKHSYGLPKAIGPSGETYL